VRDAARIGFPVPPDTDQQQEEGLMTIRFLHVALLAFALSAAPGAAQMPRPGEEVRLRIRAPLFDGAGQLDVRGVLLSLTSDSLTGTFRDQPRSIPVESILRLQVERERSRARGAGRGMLAGALVMGGAGLVIGMASSTPDARPLISESVDSGLMAAAVLGIPGALVGGLIGGLMPGRRWVTVPVE
jgi:hypothetical protein